jgi:phosphomethylpyrimidine synthase
MARTNLTRFLDGKDVKKLAAEEDIDEARLLRLLKSGRVIVARNPVHDGRLVGIGEGLRVKINANIGTSGDYADAKEELKKAAVAVKFGADAIMDLSTGGDIDGIRKKIIKTVEVPVGTVPIYQAGVELAKRNSIVDMTEDQLFGAIEKQAKDGVDFMTVHCGVTKRSVDVLQRSRRVTGIVSRGGSFLAAWIIHNGKENPLYKNYDYLLELALKYGFALSLGDGLRPGSIADASDAAQIEELIILGELVRRAREKGVPAMVEGPGHVPINQIEANVRLEKTICDGAPFYVLGPLVTDIAPGYDHITSAIGGALAAYYGADFLCYVTPAEHLSLPTLDDVKTGVIASRIAAHAADVARGRDMEMDAGMSACRKALDWDGMFGHALDAETARKVRDRRHPTKDKGVCSMCGEICVFRVLDGKK